MNDMRLNTLLWIAQGLLAGLFLFAGGMKLVIPVAALSAMAPLPGAFLKFIGAAEVLGAAGLVLPWLLTIQPRLTPLAASGLLVIMTGAVIVTLTVGPAVQAATPAIVGALLVWIALKRTEQLSGFAN